MIDLVVAVVQSALIFGVGAGLFVAGRSYERQSTERYWYRRGVREGVATERRRREQEDQGRLLRVIDGGAAHEQPARVVAPYDWGSQGV